MHERWNSTVNNKSGRGGEEEEEEEEEDGYRETMKLSIYWPTFLSSIELFYDVHTTILIRVEEGRKRSERVEIFHLSMHIYFKKWLYHLWK